MGYDTLELWRAIENCFINLRGAPTVEQIREVKSAMSLCYLSVRGTIQLEAIKKMLIEVGLNPIPKVREKINNEEIIETYSASDFIKRSIDKATKWNHGIVPEIGVRHSFLLNNLDSMRIISEADLDRLLKEEEDCPEGSGLADSLTKFSTYPRIGLLRMLLGRSVKEE